MGGKKTLRFSKTTKRKSAASLKKHSVRKDAVQKKEEDGGHGILLRQSKGILKDYIKYIRVKLIILRQVHTMKMRMTTMTRSCDHTKPITAPHYRVLNKSGAGGLEWYLNNRRLRTVVPYYHE